MRRIHVVALVALSSSGTESFVLLAGRGARRSTRPATATTLSSEERFAEELQRLPSAVDQLRAIDANDDGLLGRGEMMRLAAFVHEGFGDRGKKTLRDREALRDKLVKARGVLPFFGGEGEGYLRGEALYGQL